ncbi:hypothetical protein Tco_1120573 [Tanacetum coccineum]
MLQARENLMEAIQAFLKKYDQIPPKEKSMDLLLAEERFLKIKQAVEEEQNQPENIQELLLKLINDLQILNGIQLKQEEQAAKESSIPLRDIISELPLSIAITPDLPITDSLIMEDEHLNTIPETKSDEENESSVKDLVPIPSESEDTSENDSDCDLPSCNDFSPINIFEEKSVTFFNPLFDSNDDCTSSDDESYKIEGFWKTMLRFTRSLSFRFDARIYLCDVNHIFDEVLENIESKDSYVFNLNEPALLVTPLSDFNEDECFDPGGKINEIDAFLDMDISTDIENGYHGLEGDIIYLEVCYKWTFILISLPRHF